MKLDRPIMFVRQEGPTQWRVCCLTTEGIEWWLQTTWTGEAAAHAEAERRVAEHKRKGREVDLYRRDPRIA